MGNVQGFGEALVEPTQSEIAGKAEGMGGDISSCFGKCMVTGSST